MKYTVNDLQNYWMPFTANREFKAAPRILAKSEGVWYTDNNGNKVLDGSSGLFCCPAGHGVREIADAVYAQMLENDYCPSFQVGHPGSFELASRISRLLPDHINHVFFGCSGSEAIDSALKIVQAYHRAKGEGHRSRFVSRERAYHGVNLGGTSLSGMVRNRETFTSVLPNIVFMRDTHQQNSQKRWGQPETGAELAEDLQRAVDTFGGQTIAACFVEPIAGSTGTLVPPKGYLERLREICDENGILLVFDEVITGFGRVGSAFAATEYGVMPDIITMAKAITNGCVPMGAIGVSDDIYNTVVNAAPEGAVELFHGYTYSAHPVACAAGIATMKLYDEGGLFERARGLHSHFESAMMSLADIPVVSDVRGHGLMAGIEVAAEDGKIGKRGGRLQKEAFHAGLHIKFTGDVGIMAPAFVSTKSDIDQMAARLRSVLERE